MVKLLNCIKNVEEFYILLMFLVRGSIRKLNCKITLSVIYMTQNEFLRNIRKFVINYPKFINKSP